MKKLFCAVAAVVLLCAAALPAMAAARMPECRGALTDDADVLSAQTAKDIAAYAEMAQDEADAHIYVAVVHFLDGLDAKTYAAELFQKWNLGDDDWLILGAAGEDSFAAAMGEDVQKKLGVSNAENLLYTSSAFGDQFKRQQYDAAFGSLFVALNTLLNKQYGTDMELGGLFKSAQAPSATAQPASQSAGDYSSRLWEQVLGSIDEHTADYQQYQTQRQDSDNGIGVGGWIILIILVMIIFGQSDPVRKARNASRPHYRDYGCGCSPLGWILSMIGAGAIIDRLRRRR